MSNTGQYLVSLALIVAIAGADRYLIVESDPDSPVSDMIWVEGSRINAVIPGNVPSPDDTQHDRDTGFWIDSSVVTRAKYQRFLVESGYIGSANAKPKMQLVDGARTQVSRMDPVFALPDGDTDADGLSVLYVSKADALAFCKWTGLELSSSTQFAIAAQQLATQSKAASSPGKLLALQTEANRHGFRCVK